MVTGVLVVSAKMTYNVFVKQILPEILLQLDLLLQLPSSTIIFTELTSLQAKSPLQLFKVNEMCPDICEVKIEAVSYTAKGFHHA
jgi:hypothetical protein